MTRALDELVGRSGRGAMLALLAASLLAACGGGVARLDPRNPTLPPQSRLWIAGAEDAVVIAKAQVDEARIERRRVGRWANDIRQRLEFGDAAFRNLRDTWVQARLDHANRKVELAEAVRELALSRQDVANAEVAVAHDLATYELEPLRERAEAAATRVGDLRAGIRQSRVAEEEAATNFWEAYGVYASGGGDTGAFWTSATAAN
ncbi:MAG: hypothetical protein ACFCGT_03195 [Sandaracinaceae bacterium]